MYEKTTRDISIKVLPVYLEDQSMPERDHYVWSYTVTITNNGKKSVQLRSRYWRIIDASGSVQEVAGEGVIGDQPKLAPGQSYEYTSGTPLPTPTGFMLGNYIMEGPDGSHFEVEIPTFSLDSPYHASLIH